MSLEFKKLIHAAANKLIDARLKEINQQLVELEQNKANETKSSAGDKYETARAMFQQELDLLQRQRGSHERLKNSLAQLDPSESPLKLGLNSLIRTQQGWFYFAVPVGKVQVNDVTVHLLSVESPFAQKLMNSGWPNQSMFSTDAQILEIY
jgi:hypothetical protein